MQPKTLYAYNTIDYCQLVIVNLNPLAVTMMQRKPLLTVNGLMVTCT